MFASIRKAAVTTTDDMKALRDKWSSEQTQQLFAKARESERADADLSKAWDLPRYGWAEQ